MGKKIVICLFFIFITSVCHAVGLGKVLKTAAKGSAEAVEVLVKFFDEAARGRLKYYSACLAEETITYLKYIDIGSLTDDHEFNTILNKEAENIELQDLERFFSKISQKTGRKPGRVTKKMLMEIDYPVPQLKRMILNDLKILKLEINPQFIKNENELRTLFKVLDILYSNKRRSGFRELIQYLQTYRVADHYMYFFYVLDLGNQPQVLLSIIRFAEEKKITDLNSLEKELQGIVKNKADYAENHYKIGLDKLKNRHSEQ